jgi:hypothetical protein
MVPPRLAAEREERYGRLTGGPARREGSTAPNRLRTRHSGGPGAGCAELPSDSLLHEPGDHQCGTSYRKKDDIPFLPSLSSETAASGGGWGAATSAAGQ